MQAARTVVTGLEGLKDDYASLPGKILLRAISYNRLLKRENFFNFYVGL